VLASCLFWNGLLLDLGVEISVEAGLEEQIDVLGVGTKAVEVDDVGVA
jgi:hypothetical protein